MAYPTGHLPAGLSDTPAGTDVNRSVEARSFSPVGTSSLTFPLVTDGGRELSVTLAARPIFDLRRLVHVGARLTRTVRRAGGESALAGLHRVRLESGDFKRIDVETLRYGVDLLDLASGATGVAPTFWRTAASSRGRFSLLYTGLQSDVNAGLLLVEIVGVDMKASPDDVRAAIDHLEAQRRGVIIQAPPEAGMIARLGPARPRCLSLDFAGVETESAVHWQAASGLIAQARAVSEDVLLINLPPARGEAAARAGATHAVFCDMGRMSV